MTTKTCYLEILLEGIVTNELTVLFTVNDARYYHPLTDNSLFAEASQASSASVISPSWTTYRKVIASVPEPNAYSANSPVFILVISMGHISQHGKMMP